MYHVSVTNLLALLDLYHPTKFWAYLHHGNIIAECKIKCSVARKCQKVKDSACREDTSLASILLYRFLSRHCCSLIEILSCE